MATAAQQEFNELMRDKGHRDHHPEDDESVRPMPTSQASQSSIAMPRSSMSSSRDFIPRTRYGANTGPKGVIADAQDFRDQKRMHRQTARSSRVSLVSERHVGMAGPTFGQQTRVDKLDEQEEWGNDTDDEDDELDDDFVAQWRQGRMQELRNGGAQNRKIQSTTTRKTYSGVANVDAQRYLEAVEGSGTTTVVVVYIYDDMSQVSQLFENCLRTLSHKHEGTRFVKLHFADAEMEPAGVPALIAYRGGEKFAALVPIIDEMPEDGDLDALTLERVLQRHQVLT